MRELNRLGVLGDRRGRRLAELSRDYEVIRKLHDAGEMTIRIAYNLFTQKPNAGEGRLRELDEERQVPRRHRLLPQQRRGRDAGVFRGRLRRLPRRAAGPAQQMEDDLEGVVRVLAENRWPWRMHATYDETISRALDVFEKVNEDIPLAGLNWFFDHAKRSPSNRWTGSPRSGGGIAVQHRMAYQGEYFVERYGAQAAEATPPSRRCSPRGSRCRPDGRDARRVVQPVVSLAWLVTARRSRPEDVSAAQPA
ncbi:amidohydrolase family protein [Burkholderia cenocepacia]|nr:amidohydrolase family protein [Burkholderia cenocepacia]